MSFSGKTIGGIVAVGTMLVIVGVVAFQFGTRSAGSPTTAETSSRQLSPPPGPATTSSSPLATPAVTPTASGIGPSTATLLPPPPPPPAGTVLAPAPIDFVLAVTQTRQPSSNVLFNVKVQVYLNAALDNTGDSDAHNTNVNVRARVGNSYVTINGQNTYTLGLGTVTARTRLARDLSFEVEMSLSQGNQAQNEGITFEITVASTERTKMMPTMRCTASGCTTS